ncbi:MAG: hypothetical protein IJF03_04880 [Lachnospiraceae bacterium]|nr:hypothetical protein [Lachnospiraceae bacterium]
MSGLLELREKLKEFYGKNEMYITPVLKFVLAMVLLFAINAKMGYMSALGNPIVILVLALVCAFLPTNTTVIVCCIYIIANAYALSLEVAVVGVILVFLMFLLYFRFSPKDACVVLLVPLAFVLKIPYAAPVLIGLMATPLSMVSMCFGVIMYYYVSYVGGNAGILSAASSDMISKISMIFASMLSDKMMMLILISFMATIVVTYLIKRLNIDYVWNTAAIVGTLTNLLILLVGEFMLNAANAIAGMLISMLVSAVIVYVAQFFKFSVDYTRTEYVQFEDDEYYYYVKAVPKMTVSASSKKVQRINPQKR